MPQFDISAFSVQIISLFILFALLYILYVKQIIPKQFSLFKLRRKLQAFFSEYFTLIDSTHYGPGPKYFQKLVKKDKKKHKK